jgi:predicted nuclease with TOPRIM domain
MSSDDKTTTAMQKLSADDQTFFITLIELKDDLETLIFKTSDMSPREQLQMFKDDYEKLQMKVRTLDSEKSTYKTKIRKVRKENETLKHRLMDMQLDADWLVDFWARTTEEEDRKFVENWNIHRDNDDQLLSLHDLLGASESSIWESLIDLPTSMLLGFAL